MPGWDYSGNGYYFITLVTQNRECNLGEIVVDKTGKPYVSLSEFGKIIDNEWNKSFEMRNELYCDGYIIMPNHIHAIVILEKRGELDGPHATHVVETNGRSFLQQSPHKSPHQPKLIRLPKSISSFIGGFKSAINSKIDDYIDENNLDIPKYNRNNHFFQPNYYDHIIRNENEYQRIAKYIIDNPIKWQNDKFNGGN